ncbi:hypothetical protein LINPERHAP2_LOCUS14234 [Linum perenne]
MLLLASHLLSPFATFEQHLYPPILPLLERGGTLSHTTTPTLASATWKWILWSWVSCRVANVRRVDGGEEDMEVNSPKKKQEVKRR